MTIRVLLVDDHQMMRDGLRAILAGDGEIEVVGEAADGRRAVELARQLAPDIVLMDLGMPEMNGIEATRRIKAESPRARVIALSTHGDKRHVLGALEGGACGYVLKLCAFDELKRAVQAVSQGKTYLSPEVTKLVVDARVGGPPADAVSDGSALGPREREVLQLLAEGRSSGEIAQRLHISTRTVETHRRNLTRKLGLHSVAELTKYAVREGLTSLEK